MCGGVVGWPTTRLGRQRPPVHVWDTRQGTLVHSLRGHGGGVLALAFRDALGFEDDEDGGRDNDREQQLFSAAADGT